MIAAKILVSGMQFNSLALSMNFVFITTVTNVLNTQSTVSQLGLDSIFSSDCALESPNYNPVLVSSGLFLFSPILVFLCTLPFAALAATYSQRRRLKYLESIIEIDEKDQAGAQDYRFSSLFKNYAITASVIIIFIIHPMLTKKAFELFNCVQIGVNPNETYLYADLTVRCYGMPHLLWVLLLGLPLLIVMVGEPILFASFLHKHKAMLTQTRYKLTYAFLYKGYQPRLWIVWEVSIMARKSIIVAIAVFGNKSTRIQAHLVVALCFVVLGFHQTYKPFLDPWLNRLETLSIVTSASLYFFAQFLLRTTSDVSPGAQVFSEAMIAIFQILFLVAALIFIFYGVFHKVKEGVARRRATTKDRKSMAIEMGGGLQTLPDDTLDTALPKEPEKPIGPPSPEDKPPSNGRPSATLLARASSSAVVSPSYTSVPINPAPSSMYSGYAAKATPPVTDSTQPAQPARSMYSGYSVDPTPPVGDCSTQPAQPARSMYSGYSVDPTPPVNPTPPVDGSSTQPAPIHGSAQARSMYSGYSVDPTPPVNDSSTPHVNDSSTQPSSTDN